MNNSEEHNVTDSQTSESNDLQTKDEVSIENSEYMGADRSAVIFLNSLADGYTTSLSSHQLPLTISDKALTGSVDPQKSIKKISRDGWVITHKAAQIQNDETGKVEYYFATKPAMAALDGIWDLVNMNKCALNQKGSTFIVTFRKNDLRNYLASINKTFSGKKLNQQLEILESSVLEIFGGAPTSGDENRGLKLTGTYFQNACEIVSDDPRLDGLYRATLHPVIAQDLIQGRFRDVEKTYLTGSSEANELYKACIHKMRHTFTNADATHESVTFAVFMDDLLFSAGKMDPMTINAKRKAINMLREKMVNTGVISSKEKLESSLEFDAAHGVKDYHLVITPTVEWGKSQRRSNAKYKRQQEELRKAGVTSPAALEFVESAITKIKRRN